MFKLIKRGTIHKYEDKLSVLDSGHTSRTECSYILWKFLYQSLISVVWPLSNLQKHFLNSEVAIRGVLWKRCSWKFRKIYRKTVCVGVSFSIKLQVSGNLLKKETPTQVLPCEFCKILRTPPLAASAISRWYDARASSSN